MVQLTIAVNDPDTYSPICSTAEQIAEKYPKAFLVEHQVRFPPIHTMTILLGLCTPLDPGFAGFYNSLATLDQFYKRFPYPTGLSATYGEAQLAFQLANDIRAFVRSLLGI